MAGGRPNLCTDEVIKSISENVGLGLSLQDACDMVGIDVTTVNMWSRKARAELALMEAEGRTEPNPVYASYIRYDAALKKAKPASKAHLLGRMLRHGNKVWLADAWLLERRFPDEFSQKIKTDVNGGAGGATFIVHIYIPDNGRGDANVAPPPRPTDAVEA
jgi:hypothetical protein